MVVGHRFSAKSRCKRLALDVKPIYGRFEGRPYVRFQYFRSRVITFLVQTSLQWATANDIDYKVAGGVKIDPIMNTKSNRNSYMLIRFPGRAMRYCFRFRPEPFFRVRVAPAATTGDSDHWKVWRSLIIDSVVSTFVATMKYIRHGGQTGEIFDYA